LSIPDPSTCEEIGALVSAFAEPPDVLMLDGDLGAGKTTFSRGFIRNKIGMKNEVITSPTYLLSNTYSYKSNNIVQE
jgi:tRNA threonylcarbamoyladenosine biosynthesis protein TsaE